VLDALIREPSAEYLLELWCIIGEHLVWPAEAHEDFISEGAHHFGCGLGL
jgi:hypothetical protein